jgi:hypothetical protein
MSTKTKKARKQSTPEEEEKEEEKEEEEEEEEDQNIHSLLSSLLSHSYGQELHSVPVSVPRLHAHADLFEEEDEPLLHLRCNTRCNQCTGSKNVKMRERKNMNAITRRETQTNKTNNK